MNTGPGPSRRRFALLSRVERHLQRKMLSGLLNLVPFLITVAVVSFIIGVTDPYIRVLPLVKDRPWDVPGIGLVALMALAYLAGQALGTRWGERALNGLGFVMNHIPLVKSIYGVTHQATQTMSSQYGFSRVVFVEWPREGALAMGFVTGRARGRRHGRELVVVYIPTAPNPTSGNLAFMLSEALVETDISVEDAMRLVFSGGIVLPAELSLTGDERGRSIDRYLGEYERTGSKEKQP